MARIAKCRVCGYRCVFGLIAYSTAKLVLLQVVRLDASAKYNMTPKTVGTSELEYMHSCFDTLAPHHAASLVAPLPTSYPSSNPRLFLRPQYDGSVEGVSVNRRRLGAAACVEFPHWDQSLVHGPLRALNRKCYLRHGQLQLLFHVANDCHFSLLQRLATILHLEWLMGRAGAVLV